MPRKNFIFGRKSQILIEAQGLFHPGTFVVCLTKFVAFIKFKPG